MNDDGDAGASTADMTVHKRMKLDDETDEKDFNSADPPRQYICPHGPTCKVEQLSMAKMVPLIHKPDMIPCFYFYQGLWHFWEDDFHNMEILFQHVTDTRLENSQGTNTKCSAAQDEIARAIIELEEIFKIKTNQTIRQQCSAPYVDVLEKYATPPYCDADVQAFLGYVHMVMDQKEKTWYWLKQAALQMNADACHLMGKIYYDGQGTPVDFVRALEYFQQAAQLGSSTASFYLGIMYENGHGVPQDYIRALHWYHKAAYEGDLDAMYVVGVILRDKLERPYLREAMQWFFKAAKRNHTSSQVQVARMYDHDFVKAYPYKSSRKAFEWYLKAANNGHAESQHNVGVMYHDGAGVARNYSKAFDWYQKSAMQGHALSWRYCGDMYHYGRGVTRDLEKAMMCYQESFRLDETFEAAERIGKVLLEQGQPALALEWSRRAAMHQKDDVSTNL